MKRFVRADERDVRPVKGRHDLGRPLANNLPREESTHRVRHGVMRVDHVEVLVRSDLGQLRREAERVRRVFE